MHCAIDSATLVLPLDRVEIVSPILRAVEVTSFYDTETGELVSDTNPREVNSFVYEAIATDGTNIAYTTKYLKTRVGGRGQKPTDVLKVTINAKQLQGQYLEGITERNLPDLHRSILAEGIVNLPYEVFIQGKVEDMDVKQDEPLDSGVTFMDLAKAIEQKCDKTLFGTSSFESAKLFNSKDQGQGFQMGARDKKAKMPMLKVYNKPLELDTKSRDFRDTYLQGTDVSQNAVRYEVSFKSRMNIEKYKIAPRTQPLTLAYCASQLTGTIKVAMHNIKAQYIGIVERIECTEDASADEPADKGINRTVDVYTVIALVAELAYKAGLTLDQSLTVTQKVLQLYNKEDRSKASKRIPLRKIDDHIKAKYRASRDKAFEDELEGINKNIVEALVTFLSEKPDVQEYSNHIACNPSQMIYSTMDG